MNQKGQTLIEVLTALTAIVTVVAAITVASVTALNNAQYSRSQNLATHYAQQGMEVIRNMRDLNIGSVNEAALPDGTYCLAKGCTSINSSPGQCGTPINNSCGINNNLSNADSFLRTVTIGHNTTSCDPSTGDVEVGVSVAWYDGRCTSNDPSALFCHQVRVTSCLSDFTVVPTP